MLGYKIVRPERVVVSTESSLTTVRLNVDIVDRAIDACSPETVSQLGAELDSYLASLAMLGITSDDQKRSKLSAIV